MKVHKETFNLTKEYGCMETDAEYSKRVGLSVLMDYEEICEALVGDDAMKTHTHQDILAYINQLKNTEEEFKYQNNIA